MKTKINLLKANDVAKQYIGIELFVLWTIECKIILKIKFYICMKEMLVKPLLMLSTPFPEVFPKVQDRKS